MLSHFVSKFALILFLTLPACAQTWFSNLAQSHTTSSCTVTWTTAVPTTAHINYGLTAGSYTKYTADTAQYSRTATQVISGLTAGTTYHFKIVASDTTHSWATSMDNVCTTNKVTTAQHSVQLKWNPSNSAGVTGYKVYRSTISGGYYALLSGATGLIFTDTMVQSGTTYYYVVAALNGAGQQSPYSNQVKALIP
jgi:fibronectin type 3 domain-containing protein